MITDETKLTYVMPIDGFFRVFNNYAASGKNCIKTSLFVMTYEYIHHFVTIPGVIEE